MGVSRRRFLRALGGGVAALSGAVLGACDPRDTGPRLRPFRNVFDEAFESEGPGWGDEWMSFRYEAKL
jgi:hypothetical protein